jgi:hypothetical protein
MHLERPVVRLCLALAVLCVFGCEDERIVRINGVIAITARHQTFPLQRGPVEKPRRNLYTAFSVRTGITVFCEWFAERFDTRDLKDAKALLEQLG